MGIRCRHATPLGQPILIIFCSIIKAPYYSIHYKLQDHLLHSLYLFQMACWYYSMHLTYCKNPTIYLINNRLLTTRKGNPIKKTYAVQSSFLFQIQWIVQGVKGMLDWKIMLMFYCLLDTGVGEEPGREGWERRGATKRKLSSECGKFARFL